LLTGFVIEFKFNLDSKNIVAKNTAKSNASPFCVLIFSSIKKIILWIGMCVYYN